MFYSWGRIKSGQAELRPSPARITVRRSQSPALGPRQTFAEARQEAFKGSYWKEIKIGLKKGKVSPQHHP